MVRRRESEQYAEGVDIVGIGEHVHGELLSWKHRLELVRRWLSNGHRVLVLCETLDFYVQGMRAREPFIFHEDELNGVRRLGFTPCLMPFACYTREHLEIMRSFAALPQDAVTFFGIDVQLLDHPLLLASTEHSELRSILTRRHRLPWAADAESERRGETRNRLNADTILLLARMHPKHKVVYFAQNEHVAFDCDATRRTQGQYVTEGAILKRRLGNRYVSIATFATVMWNAAWNVTRRGAIQTRKTFSKMDNYRPSDFDHVIAEKSSPRMTPLRVDIDDPHDTFFSRSRARPSCFALKSTPSMLG